ncbi:Kinesin-6 [Giardia muris]|uniref:Kinesin-6 n=1 Tax=Giardia muris TaxID=5742 RepID=A0A4Z1T4N4_GIAMU|nr:Kinesin-6 [Giardia muris]|eukprot:TNJ28953.1 Kinesin-6 [Giardia muris]
MLPPKLTQRQAKASQPTRMQVVVRVRPPTKSEYEAGVTALMFSENAIQVRTNATRRPESLTDGPVIADNTQTRERKFTFDHLFEPNSSQNEVYYSIGQDLVDAALSGVNAALICYGVTGSGKTYSLSNLEPGKEGLVVRCCTHLFEKAAEDHADVTISVSYYQIYLEQVYDLLPFETIDPVSGSQIKSIEQRTKKLSDPKQTIPGLPVREGRDGTVFVEGLSSHLCRSMAELQHLLTIGESNKFFASTQMNQASSRSHVILDLRISVNARRTPSHGSERLYSTFLFVDLAGSERQSRTEATGRRLEEAKFINKSLTALGKIVAALSNKGAAETKSELHQSSVSKQRSSSAASSTPSLARDPLYDDYLDDDLGASGSSSGKSSNSSTRSHSPSGTALQKSASRDSLTEESAKQHIPWRDSKLTRLLKNVLGGNSRATLMVNVSPADSMIHETVTSLMFGKRAMSIVQAPRVNIAGSLKAISEQMQAELDDMSERLVKAEEENTRLKTFVLELEDQNHILTEQLAAKTRELAETEAYYKDVFDRLRGSTAGSRPPSGTHDCSLSIESPISRGYSKPGLSISPSHKHFDEGPLLADHRSMSPRDSCTGPDPGVTVNSLSTLVAAKALLTNKSVYDGIPRYGSADSPGLDSPRQQASQRKRASAGSDELFHGATVVSPISPKQELVRELKAAFACPDSLQNVSTASNSGLAAASARGSTLSMREDVEAELVLLRSENLELQQKCQALLRQAKAGSSQEQGAENEISSTKELHQQRKLFTEITAYLRSLAIIKCINYRDGYAVEPQHVSKLLTLLTSLDEASSKHSYVLILRELIKLEVLMMMVLENKAQMKDMMAASISSTANMPHAAPTSSATVRQLLSNVSEASAADYFIAEDLFAWIKDLDESTLIDPKTTRVRFVADQGMGGPQQITVRNQTARVRGESELAENTVSTQTLMVETNSPDQIPARFADSAPCLASAKADARKLNLYEIGQMSTTLSSARVPADIPASMMENIAIQSVRLFADIVSAIGNSTAASKATLSSFETATSTPEQCLEFAKLVDGALASLNTDFSLLREIIIVYELYIEKLLEFARSAPESIRAAGDLDAYALVLSRIKQTLQASGDAVLVGLGKQLNMCNTPVTSLRLFADYFSDNRLVGRQPALAT